MSLRKLLAATAVLVLSGLSAYPDTLVMNDGRRIRGTLVSVTGGWVTFTQESNGRRIRVRLDRVDDINLRDTFSDEYDNNSGYSSDRNNNDRNNNDRNSNDRYGNDRNNNETYAPQSIAVYADRQWTDTSINVRAGDTLRFNATGVVAWGPGRRDGPAGEVNSPYNQGRPIPDMPGAALIGRVGNGEPFYIGEGQAGYRVRTSGRLYLGINDDYLQDNQGHFQVTVQRQTSY